jgi:DNA-binding transcriptional regulator GbsR (MarR family)
VLGEDVRLAIQKKEKLSPEIQNLANRVGQFIEYWGFKSIHGRIWTLLFLSEEPLSSIDISRKLKVSKTLLSFSVAELLKFEVIQEAGKGSKRTIYFRANPNISAVILNVLRMRERPMMAEIHSSFEGVNQISRRAEGDLKVNDAHLQKMGDFISAAKSVLDSLIIHTDPDSELIQQFLLISAVLAGKN